MNPSRYVFGLALFALVAGLVAPANTGWEEVGAGSASGGGISNFGGWLEYNPSLAVGDDGEPIIAWEQATNSIFVRRWNGMSWAEIGLGSASGGDINNNGGRARTPSLAIGLGDTPIIAWQDESSGNWEIYVRRWNGTDWVELGGSATGGGISNTKNYSGNPSLAIGPNGTLFVAWLSDVTGNIEIYVRRWDGTAWVEIGSGSATGGGISNNVGYSNQPSLAIGPDAMPVVAWEDDSSGDTEIYVRRWDGFTWAEMGPGSATGGGISDNSGKSFQPSVAFGADRMPIVTWGDGSSGDTEIYVRRWNGSAWVEMGTESASDGGVSDNNGDSGLPSLAIGPDGTPTIAWSDSSSGNVEIYVRRWNGSMWVEVGPVSATGGGISNNGGESLSPSVAIDPDGKPVVAWADKSSGDNEIYLRRWNSGVTCFTLTVTHTGSGGNPTASPPNSVGCGAGRYTAGQVITLDAAPAAGHRVKNWSGTNNNASTAATISLTMPAANHNASVIYDVIPGTIFRAFTPAVLNVLLACFPGPDETEPNNTAAGANGPLCNGSTYKGRPNDEYDIFYVDLRRPGDITVTMSNHHSPDVQLALHYQAISSNALDIDVNGSDGFSVGRINGQPGRYFIVIYVPEGNTGGSAQYSLRATFTE